MRIGDKVSFIDETYSKRRYGFIKRLNNDGTKAVVSVTGKYTHAWIKVEKLELVTE